MNHSNQHQHEVEQDRFALRIAAVLSDASQELPRDISERLRASRMQALAKRKISVTKTASITSFSGGAATLTFGNENFTGWNRLAAAASLLALVASLIAINVIQDDSRADEIAEIDSALLTDDLPPMAYADDGFTHFLKQTRGQNP